MKLDDLYTAAIALGELMINEDHVDMQKHIEMILGNVIMPEVLKMDPDVLKSHPEYKTLLDAYTPEKVKKALTPETIEKVVEKVVEKPVEKIVEKVIEKRVPVDGTSVRKDSGHDPCNDGGKYRRLKDDGVNKISRKKREIDCLVRDTIITWWNQSQTLVDKDDPVCQKLADDCNAGTPHLPPLSSYQVTGYISRLVTWGRLSSSHREEKFDKMIKKGLFTIRPEYTPELIQKIIDNYNRQREDERIREEAHKKMRAQKGTQSKASTVQTSSQPASQEEDKVTGKAEVEKVSSEETPSVPASAIETDDDIEIIFS